MDLFAQSQKKALVLVIDDDQVTRKLMHRILTREGYEVAEARDGAEGLDLYSRLHPDIVLLDAMMPVMDGFICCARLQTLSGGDRTPVLFITNLGDEGSVDRAFAAGATDYMTKPIHWALLRQRIKRLLQQAQLYRELEGNNQVLQRLVTTDSLTQIANRRRFDEYLDQTWRQMLQDQSYLSLILCDIDFFKAYNDTWGHQAGDLCLQQVARVLKGVSKRSTDLVARYGGEEFAVVLPHTDLHSAQVLAEAMRWQLRALEIPHSQSPISPFVTLSLGIASTQPQSETTPAKLVTAADQALYQAKAQGRDRVSLSGLNDDDSIMFEHSSCEEKSWTA